MEKKKKKLSISDLYLYWLTEEWLLWVRMQCADGCFGKISFRLTSSKPFRAVCANSLQSGLALYLPYGLEPARLLSPWDSPDKITRVGCCAHPQVIFLTQVKNPSTNSGDIRDMGLIPGSGRSPGDGHSNPP